MTDEEASGEHPPPYMIFLVVFLFFLTGLLGFLICHLLKKKGYRCRTGDMDEDEEEEKLGGDADDEDEENQDTVEQILKCIIENEANMEAFNEMLGNHNVCVRHDPRLRKESIGGVPPHHHTVHSGTDHNSCHLCAQVRSKKGRRQSRTPRSRQRPGEQTVFSVGRFRVTHTDKKPPGGVNPLAVSGDQLDQSQDSEERKEGGYNLRSMFKEVRPPAEGANGIAANVGKRRKSVTIFGLRRGSDPVAVKGGEGPGKEAAGVRFAVQQRSTEPEPEPRASVSPPSPESQKPSQSSGPGPAAGPGSGPGPGPASVPAAPSSLPFASVRRVEVMKAEDDPGPLQTSTPLAPVPGSAPGFGPNVSTDRPEPGSTAGLSVTQTSPDPRSSLGLHPGAGASSASVSADSSPPSSFPIKTPSSASLLKTPTSPSPKPILRNKPSESAETSPALTPSPKLLSSRSPPSSSSSFGRSSGPPSPARTDPRLEAPSSAPADRNPSSPSSPRLPGRSEGVTSSMTKGDVVSSPSSPKQREPEAAKSPKTEGKTEMKRAGILKTSKLPPAASEKSQGSSDQLKDRRSSLPLSPSSPQGGAMSTVTIVKASPDSRREFSVVTTVEEVKDQTGGSCEQEGGPAEGKEDPGAEKKPTLGQDKDDMMEMEDIRDCKVTRRDGQDGEETGLKVEEEEMDKMEKKQD